MTHNNKEIILDRTSIEKDLGVHTDENLKFDKHADSGN